MKMKHWCLASSLMVVVGCANNETAEQPSVAQEQSAHAAYEKLRDGDFEQFKNHLEPELQTYFQDNEKIMKRFSKSIPKKTYKSRQLMSKTIEQDQKGQSQYKLSYEYAYPNNLVQYDVSFDRAGGSDKIKNVNIQVFGASQ